MTAGTVASTVTRQAALWVRHGHAVYIGPGFDLGRHATAVACLGVGLDGPFTVRTDDAGELACRSFLFRARVHHEMRCGGGRMSFVFFDPTSARMVRSLDAMRRRVGEFGVDHRHEAELIAVATAQPVDFPQLLELAGVPLPGVPDPRIAKAAAAIRDEPATPHRAPAAAQAVGLSAAYFQRLFAAQTGTSFRRYVQWARMLAATRAAAAGLDFTQAAVDAGFASPSHFSDTFKAMFGLTPTALASVHGPLEIYEDLA
jgi:AraC-like DNA-binding protein